MVGRGVVREGAILPLPRRARACTVAATSLPATMDPKCLYGLDGSDSGFEMSFDSETEAAAFSLDDTAGSEGFGGSSAASVIDDDPGQPAKPKKRRQRRTRERSPTQVLKTHVSRR